MFLVSYKDFKILDEIVWNCKAEFVILLCDHNDLIIFSVCILYWMEFYNIWHPRGYPVSFTKKKY